MIMSITMMTRYISIVMKIMIKEKLKR